MSNLYRIYPTLWDGAGNQGQAATVYAIDRKPAQIPTACSARPRADPAATWEGPTFQRLLPPPNTGCGPQQAVTWATLPAWISYILPLGYALAENTSMGKLKPYGDLYITGP